MYAWPNTVEGGAVEQIDVARVTVTPGEAILKANELAGRTLPTTALTLLMKDGRPQYQSIGGLGAESIYVDAATGEARMAEPPAWTTSFFRHAHFYYFAGGWQVTLLVFFSALATLSALTGIYLNISHWWQRMSPRRRRRYLSS
jgi:hypothetical protein